MSNRIVSVVAIALLSGCVASSAPKSVTAASSSTTASEPVTPASHPKIHVEQFGHSKTKEVLVGELRVISQANWALSVPSLMTGIEVPPAVAMAGIDAAYVNPEKTDMVTFGVKPTDKDLDGTTSDAAQDISDADGKILEGYAGMIDGKPAKLIVFAMGDSVIGAEIIVVRDGKAYVMGCMQHADHITGLCMDTAKTIRIR